MKYELMIRSRAKRNESIPMKHANFFQELAKIAQPWGIGNSRIPAAPDPGPNLGAGVTIGNLLGKGVRGRVYYAFRWDFEDLGMYDDFVDMSFNPENVEFRQLVTEVLPQLIVSFDAYFAQIGDVKFGVQDFAAERAAGLGDTRFGVYRVFPVCFFDRILCERAFQRSPGEIASRLDGHVEAVKLLGDGVYIIGSSRPLEMDEADKLCGKMKQLIIAT